VDILHVVGQDLLLGQDFWRWHSLLIERDRPILRWAYAPGEQPNYNLDSDNWEDPYLNDTDSKWEDLDEDHNSNW
jgi:hypothetical protein